MKRVIMLSLVAGAALAQDAPTTGTSTTVTTEGIALSTSPRPLHKGPGVRGGEATFSSRNLGELKASAGREGMTCVLLGFEQPGDGGGGTFYWAAQPPAPANDGTIVAAKDGGAWVRLFDGPIRASWFGAIPFSEETTPASDSVAEATRRLQRALEAAAGNALNLSAGIFYVSDTLIIPANTQVAGAGPHDVWTRGKGGTTVRPYGAGKPQIWQDTGTPEKDQMRPLLVFGGSNVRLRNLGLQTVEDPKTGTPCRDVGVLLPSTKRCSLDQVTIQGLRQVGTDDPGRGRGQA